MLSVGDAKFQVCQCLYSDSAALTVTPALDLPSPFGYRSVVWVWAVMCHEEKAVGWDFCLHESYTLNTHVTLAFRCLCRPASQQGPVQG
jgi:hypothetical protein